jgi:two-component system, OmpR family, sensor kinase
MFRARGRTLSARLIAIVAVLLTLACAVVGGATYLAVHRQLMASLDQEVTSATQRWVECVGMAKNGHHPAPDTQSSKPVNAGECNGPGTYEAVQSGSGFSSYLAFGSTPKLSAADQHTLTALPATKLPAGPLPAGGGPGQGQGGPGDNGSGVTWCTQPPPAPVYTVTLLGEAYRVSKVSCAGTVMVTGLLLGPTQHNIDTVLITELIAFGVVLVLAVGSGIWLVRLSLRPLRRVAATATAVAELPLDSGEVALPGRVPDTDPRTEVGQVGAAFNRMLGHVERALGRRAASEARLRRFAADASHELRTPLSAIRGYAELALRHTGPVPDDVMHALGRVQSESARMSVLVDDLLLLARLDAGRPLDSEPVDLSRLCIDVTSDAQVAHRDHRWRLDLPDDPVVVLGDEHRLHQVLANLLSNAGKHTPAGTTVTVTLTDPDPAGSVPLPGPLTPPGPVPLPGSVPLPGPLTPPGPVTITVHDDGPGIPAELIPELFERFTRADTSRWRADDARGGTSTGLGLAIVDAVVSAHNGTIAVSSRPGDTRFTITLPRGTS